MSSIPDKDELLRRIKALEKENRELRAGVKELSVRAYEDKYGGHPIVTFRVGKKAFSLGLRKASIVLAASDYLTRFLEKHGFRPEIDLIWSESKPEPLAEPEEDLSI
jgi:hypothetical protein